VIVVPWTTVVTVVEPVTRGEVEMDDDELGEVGGFVGEFVGEFVGDVGGFVGGLVGGVLEVVSPSEHEDPKSVAVAWVTVTGMVVTTGTCTVLTDPSMNRDQRNFPLEEE